MYFTNGAVASAPQQGRADQSATRTEKVRRARETIEEHVKVLAEEMGRGKSERLREFLEYFSQFHHYSLGNLILAMCQRANITRLAGLRQWNKMGRTVKPGEKGIMILAPIMAKKDEKKPRDGEHGDQNDETGTATSLEVDSDEERTVVYFKPVYVFDQGQTVGEDPPSLIHAHGDATRLWPALKRRVTHIAKIRLEFEEVIKACPAARGVSMGGRIVMRSDLEEADAVRVLVHEYAHELLNHRASDLDRKVRETEADATAYVVCRHFGIECDSSDYLQLYAATPGLLFNRLETIRDAAHWIIEGVEEELARMNQFE